MKWQFESVDAKRARAGVIALREIRPGARRALWTGFLEPRRSCNNNNNNDDNILTRMAI